MDGPGETCTDMDICKDCHSPAPPEGDDGQYNCYPVKHRKYYASHFYPVTGSTQMKTEIVTNGPLACGMMVTDEFHKYTDGIYAENYTLPLINHIISVVGYGFDEDS